MRAALGSAAAAGTWVLLARGLWAGWREQREADQLDALTHARHAAAMAALRRVTPIPTEWRTQ